VSQSTLVLSVPPAEHAALRQRLAAETFEFRTVPHAVFSVKGSEIVATLYRSGKLVVQGRDPELFVERFVAGAASAAPKKADKKPVEAARGPIVGSDECGKGDWFGPLVVVAVRLSPEDAKRISGSGVCDSKRLSDETALRMGAALRGLVPHAVERLDPPDYNRVYGREGALNELLASLHVRAIRAVARPGDRVLVDQFSRQDLIGPHLADLGVDFQQRPRAESDPAVAAASVIAREEFLRAMQELSEQWVVDLHKGAGSPVDRAGVEFVRLHGFEQLSKVAKLHFKNTEKVRQRLGGGR
jgi:ribonuclease HIII